MSLIHKFEKEKELESPLIHKFRDDEVEKECDGSLIHKWAQEEPNEDNNSE